MGHDARTLDDAILWDVVDEHLDEREFGVEQFERALQDPVRTLRDVARYPEQRLLAHIDALVVGGAPVAEQRRGANPVVAAGAALTEPLVAAPNGLRAVSWPTGSS